MLRSSVRARRSAILLQRRWHAEPLDSLQNPGEQLTQHRNLGHLERDILGVLSRTFRVVWLFRPGRSLASYQGQVGAMFSRRRFTDEISAVLIGPSVFTSLVAGSCGRLSPCSPSAISS